MAALSFNKKFRPENCTECKRTILGWYCIRFSFAFFRLICTVCMWWWEQTCHSHHACVRWRALRTSCAAVRRWSQSSAVTKSSELNSTSTGAKSLWWGGGFSLVSFLVKCKGLQDNRPHLHKHTVRLYSTWTMLKVWHASFKYIQLKWLSCAKLWFCNMLTNYDFLFVVCLLSLRLV